MQDVVASTVNGATGSIADLAERFEAAEEGAHGPTVADLLSALDDPDGGDSPDDGGTPVQIFYSPTNHYHFDGEAPSKEDIAGAESMSQEEFNRRVDRYFKDRQRTHFRG